MHEPSERTPGQGITASATLPISEQLGMASCLKQKEVVLYSD